MSFFRNYHLNLILIIVVFFIIFVGAKDNDPSRCYYSAENNWQNCEYMKKWTIKCDEQQKFCYDAIMSQSNQQENSFKPIKRFNFMNGNAFIEQNGRNMKNYSLTNDTTLQEAFFKQIGDGLFMEDILWKDLFTEIKQTTLGNQILNNKSKNACPRCCFDIKKCTDRSPYLVGKYPMNKTTPNNMEEMVEKYPNVKNGSWQPTECQQERMRIAIVIPYRNRTAHLMTLLNNLHSFLQRQQANYRIFVADQAYPKDGIIDKFNRAKILNSAFKEIKKIWGKNDSTDCYIFHDVDLVPDYDTNIYRCGPGPIRLFATADEWNYWTRSDSDQAVVGSICAQTGEQFIKANGFPNIYWGWGSEDADMRYRYKASNQEVEFTKRPIGDYTSLELIDKPNDSTNPKIADKCDIILRKWRVEKWQTDGLNDLDYELRKIEYLPLYINISIDVLMAKSLKLKPHPCGDIFN